MTDIYCINLSGILLRKIMINGSKKQLKRKKYFPFFKCSSAYLLSFLSVKPVLMNYKNKILYIKKIAPVEIKGWGIIIQNRSRHSLKID
jgi:hypothetical protein